MEFSWNDHKIQADLLDLTRSEKHWARNRRNQLNFVHYLDAPHYSEVGYVRSSRDYIRQLQKQK